METKCRDNWNKEFLPFAPPEASKKPEDTFLNELIGLPLINAEKDEFENYPYSEPTAIPAISAECERVFNSTKRLITPERNRLVEEVIEESECLKNE
jgi:hypothetical protein